MVFVGQFFAFPLSLLKIKLHLFALYDLKRLICIPIIMLHTSIFRTVLSPIQAHHMAYRIDRYFGFGI